MSKTKEWRALDYCEDNRGGSQAIVEQDAEQTNITKQLSEEWIIIKDSECVNVETTDTQVALSLQIGIEAALAIVLRLAIADDNQVEDILQDFKQISKTNQSNRQKTIVEKSKYVDIVTVDTDIAVHLQILIQLLLGVIATLDIL
ncbi:spore coat protein [Oceanobacillus luteolus]|uniref:Spore coat protein n=1 Tax=Oceanobacillus luteolus TaxID=1274358 RepID=A0ABW4HXM1_9BACI|nr:spore coat protein [Oceanobacillus luteolus]MCM3740863.1 spore coat protein [Oceanobacillus luteolus]